MFGLLLLALFAPGFSMVASRVSKTIVTAPMLFIGFGYLLSRTGWMPEVEAEKMLHLVAEITLIALLFLDAAQMRLRALRERHTWPPRMLVLGPPLSMALGKLAAIHP